MKTTTRIPIPEDRDKILDLIDHFEKVLSEAEEKRLEYACNKEPTKEIETTVECISYNYFLTKLYESLEKIKTDQSNQSTP